MEKLSIKTFYWKDNYATVNYPEVRFARVIKIDEAKKRLSEKGLDVSFLHSPFSKHPAPIASLWLLTPPLDKRD